MTDINTKNFNIDLKYEVWTEIGTGCCGPLSNAKDHSIIVKNLERVENWKLYDSGVDNIILESGYNYIIYKFDVDVKTLIDSYDLQVKEINKGHYIFNNADSSSSLFEKDETTINFIHKDHLKG